MTYHKKKFGGGKGRGNSNRGGGFNREKVNFKTTCADCGNDCTVPFKPNGRKPVLCRDCFDGGDKRDSGRSKFGDRKPFKKSFDKPRFEKRGPDPAVQNELKQIKRKLDRVLQILEEVTVVEVDEDNE